MKFCKNCSASLDDEAVFCNECGASVDYSSSQTTNTVPPYNPVETTQGFGGDVEGEPPAYAKSNTYSSQYETPQIAEVRSNPGQTWLIVSIISLFCCGGFLAIPGLVLSIISMSRFSSGDYAEAEEKANTAKILVFVGIGVAVIASIVIGSLVISQMIQTGSFY